MDRKVSFVLGTVVALCLAGSARAAATFTLGFDGAPTGTIEGVAGTPQTWTIYSTLTTTDNDLADGAQGWQIGLKSTNVTFTKASL